MSLGSKVRYNLLSSFLEASSILSEGRLARNMSGISLILFFEMIRSSKLRSLLSTLGMEAIWLLGGKKKEGRGKQGIRRKEEEKGKRKGRRGRGRGKREKERRGRRKEERGKRKGGEGKGKRGEGEETGGRQEEGG